MTIRERYEDRQNREARCCYLSPDDDVSTLLGLVDEMAELLRENQRFYKQKWHKRQDVILTRVNEIVG